MDFLSSVVDPNKNDREFTVFFICLYVIKI